MPRPRKPSTLRLVTGEALRHPRREKRGSEAPALRATPPAWMDAGPAEVFRELVAASGGRLIETDRPAVELTSTLLWRFRQGQLHKAAELAVLRLCLADLGASPTSRGRVPAPVEAPPPDPAEAFFEPARPRR